MFDTSARFDCIVSVEMLEHMRNWQELFARVYRWLKPGGSFFTHVFVHRTVPYSAPKTFVVAIPANVQVGRSG